MRSKFVNRRDFLKMTGIGSAAFLLGKPFSSIWSQAEPLVPDAEISITASEKYVQILSGAQTHVWGYEGQLLSGMA